MCRALRRAARMLMMAIALGVLARPAMARPFDSGPAQGEAASVSLSPAYARWLEIKLELAYLADETTFPCPLAVHVRNGQIEVMGAVCSETARARAVQIAKQLGVLPVRDGLALQANLAATPGDSSTLRASALHLLRGHLAEKASNVKVMARENGQLVLQGTTNSFEEQLAISKLLWRVPGCKSIRNDLQVTSFSYKGRTFQRVTQDGQLTMTAADHVSVQTSPVSRTASQSAANGAPDRGTQVIYKVTSYPRLSSGQTTDSNTPDKSTATGDRLLVQVAGSEPAPSQTVAIPERASFPASPVGSGVSVTTADHDLPVAPGLPAGASSESANPRLVAVPDGTTFSTHQVAQQRPVGGLFARLFPFGSKADPTTGAETATVVTVSPSFTTVSEPAPAPAGPHPSPDLAVNQTPYTSNGVVIFNEEVSMPSPEQMAAAYADLKNRVVAATAGKAHYVDIVTGADRVRTIKVSVTNVALEKEIRERILKLPEVKSGSVSLEITVAPD